MISLLDHMACIELPPYTREGTKNQVQKLTALLPAAGGERESRIYDRGHTFFLHLENIRR